MKTSTKITIGMVSGITILAIINNPELIEQHIIKQLNQHFSNQKIYGIWMHKGSTNPLNHRYRGGVNIQQNGFLYQYRFITNQFGKIKHLKLINRRLYN